MTTIRKLAISYNHQACNKARKSRNDEEAFGNTFKGEYGKCSPRGGTFKRLLLKDLKRGLK